MKKNTTAKSTGGEVQSQPRWTRDYGSSQTITINAWPEPYADIMLSKFK
ncbi:MAG TPA: hypothetical protein VGC08_06785 [Pedobacter sp.]